MAFASLSIMTLGITPIGRVRDVEFGIFVLFATIGL